MIFKKDNDNQRLQVQYANLTYYIKYLLSFDIILYFYDQIWLKSSHIITHEPLAQ